VPGTGEIFWHTEIGDNEEELPEDIDDEKYIAIPYKNDLNLGKQLALSFLQEYLPEPMEKVGIAVDQYRFDESGKS